MLCFSAYGSDVIYLPSQTVDKESNREGTKNASNREDGHRNGPDSCEEAAGNLLPVTFFIRLIDEILNDLFKKRRHSFTAQI